MLSSWKGQISSWLPHHWGFQCLAHQQNEINIERWGAMPGCPGCVQIVKGGQPKPRRCSPWRVARVKVTLGRNIHPGDEFHL
eukprot:3274551-Amphidinium_carterae.1